MPSDDQTPDADPSKPAPAEAARPEPDAAAQRNAKLPQLGRRAIMAIAGVGLLAAGAAIGAGGMAMSRPAAQMAPLVPVATSAAKEDTIVTLKGAVAEIFGNKFILADSAGRALVDTGRKGEGGKLVRPNEAVTVQGRFDGGYLRAAFLVRADGTTASLGPLKGPPHERKRGPDRDRDRGPAGDRSDGPPPPDGKL